MKSEKKLRKELLANYEKNVDRKAEWEEGMLEERSYYDIDALEKHNKRVRDQIDYWQNKFVPANFLGKWWASLQIEKLQKKLKKFL